jgi:hypothetical protein
MRSITRLFRAIVLACTASAGLALAQNVDTVTGGGTYFGTPSGARGNFGLNASEDLTGHLNYVDHGIRMHVDSTSITSYTIVDFRTRTFTGTCTVNGVGGFTFTVTVVDFAEPGRHADTFEITLSNGYHAIGSLSGGNVQVHPAG